jgi:hypothetical protein
MWLFNVWWSMFNIEQLNGQTCVIWSYLIISKQRNITHCNPVKVRNAANGMQTRFKIYCHCAPGDNPSQSETSGHIGGSGNHPCRKCDLGGTQKLRETDDEFHASFFGVCIENKYLAGAYFTNCKLCIAWKTAFIRWNSSTGRRTTSCSLSWNCSRCKGPADKNRC